MILGGDGRRTKEGREGEEQMDQVNTNSTVNEVEKLAFSVDEAQNGQWVNASMGDDDDHGGIMIMGVKMSMSNRHEY
jgi:hypothetical protein